MKSWLRPFGVVFYIGFFALAIALAYSLMVFGVLWADQMALAALRAFGVAFVGAGLTMWVMLRRLEADDDALNPLLGFLVVAGIALALVGLIFPYTDFSAPLQWAAMGAALAGLAIGLILMLLDPAFPQPIAKSWPEDAAPILTRFAHEEEFHDHAAGYAGAGGQQDDLTVIEGIDAEVQALLYVAGLQTYEDVATMEPDDLEKLLEMSEYPGAVDTRSWPVQAQLAADGDWEALQAAQAELAADRPV